MNAYFPSEGEPVFVRPMSGYYTLAPWRRGVVMPSDDVPYPGFKVRIDGNDEHVFYAMPAEIRPAPFVD